MKNMKIGAKIIFGFGSTIAMMLIVAIVVCITNLRSINNVENIDLDSALQTSARSVLDGFNAAEVQATILYSILSEEADTAFKESVAQTEENYVKTIALIDENSVLEEFRPDMERFKQEFDAWTKQVDGVIAYNSQLAEGINNMTQSGSEMFEVSGLLMQEQIELLHNTDAVALESSTTPPADLIYMAQQVNEHIAAFRVEARTLMGTFQTDKVDYILEHIEAALTISTAYRDTASLQASKDNAQRIIDVVTSYKENLIVFAQICDASSVAISTAIPAGASAAASIHTASDAMDVSMTNQVTNTQSNASLALVIMLALVVLAIIVSIVLAVIIVRAITTPLKLMQDILTQVGETGNLAISEAQTSKVGLFSSYKDETGQSLLAFSTMMNRLVYISHSLERVASKDLTEEIELLTPQDTMGKALLTMVDNLNKMFAEINGVASQVSSASGEIATGAQSLAQGSTQQASTVQEISASISEINEDMTLSAKTATGAATHGNEISAIAQKGSEQMDTMMQAVSEINNASTAIGQVIKVIDDIAFQTNILALNAAVEAARAGEHGKGFAVVADEVRNLAGKSAAAAKKTAVLISENIEKTELGLSISKQTAESLQTIISGIQETSASLQTIAAQSEQSKMATAQVNMAVEQVAQVVQQNSATSEESAAASEEMSSLARVLQQLIDEFQLKNTSTANRILLPAETGGPTRQEPSGHNEVSFIF